MPHLNTTVVWLVGKKLKGFCGHVGNIAHVVTRIKPQHQADVGTYLIHSHLSLLGPSSRIRETN